MGRWYRGARIPRVNYQLSLRGDEESKWHSKPEISQYFIHLSFLINHEDETLVGFFDDKLFSQVSSDRKMWFFSADAESPQRWKLKPSKPARNSIFMEIFLLPKSFSSSGLVLVESALCTVTATLFIKPRAARNTQDATAAHFYNLGNRQPHAWEIYEKRAYFSDRRQYDKWILMSRRNKDEKMF